MIRRSRTQAVAPLRPKVSVESIVLGTFVFISLMIAVYFAYQAVMDRPRITISTTPSPVKSSAEMSEASRELLATAAKIKAEMHPQAAAIHVPAEVARSPMGMASTIEAIKTATKGDGAIRPVFVNGQKVDDVLVRAAMFENHDFMVPESYEIKPLPRQVVRDLTPPKNFFAPPKPLFKDGASAADSA